MPVTVSDEVDLVETPERRIIDLAARGLFPLMSLGRYRYLSARDPLPPQVHGSLLQLALPIRGAVTFTVDDVDYRITPGSVLSIPPGHVYLTGATAQPRGEMAWMILHTGRTDDADEAVCGAIEVLRETGVAMWPVPSSVASDVRRGFQLAASPTDWMTNAELRHVLCAMLFTLVRGASARLADAVEPHHRDISRTLVWIDEHLSDIADTAQLVAVSGLSSSRFYEAFKAVTGTSPKDYLMRRKTDYANKWLAEDPDVTVTDVAHTLGFSSSQQFATVFRRYQGMTPSDARPRVGAYAPSSES
ncbi:MAG TPA: AraC family transcriptional regulator [Actinokineospora sp.]|nr:AraC family transcriptional regulator [Actinokineospora sp.]